MTLDQSTFLDICKALGAVPEPEAELRRRQSPRFQVDHEISMKRHGVHGAASRSVTLLNISASGLCVVDRMPASAGDQIIVSLPMSGGGNISVICTVRQSRLSATGAFRIGAEFSDQMQQESRIIRGAAGIVAASPTSQEPQTTTNQPAVLRLTTPDGGDKTVKAEVTSFKDGRFHILTSQPIPAGEALVLEFHFSDHRIQLWRCVVTQTQATGPGKYAVTARNEGAAATARSGGLRGWLRRHFGAAG